MRSIELESCGAQGARQRLGRWRFVGSFGREIDASNVLDMARKGANMLTLDPMIPTIALLQYRFHDAMRGK